MRIETNRAYNEAENYISKIESENREITEISEGKLEEMSAAIEVGNGIGNKTVSKEIKPKKEKKSNFSNTDTKNNSIAVVKGGSRNTTVSYQLVNRKALELPNPVYTCEGFGKVVINIEVSDTGRVIKSSYSGGTSTTENQCLIDSALEYAARARFTTEGSRPKQIGTITFNFPGQD